MTDEPNKIRRSVRTLRCHPGRSDDYREGHRNAIRGAITFLHLLAREMNDPTARKVLNNAGFWLGNAARDAREGLD